MKTLAYLVIYSSFLDLPYGQFAVADLMRRRGRLSYLSSSLSTSGKLPVRIECDGKSKELVMNKLPNRRFFIAAEKWMVRSIGVGGFVSLQNGNLRR